MRTSDPITLDRSPGALFAVEGSPAPGGSKTIGRTKAGRLFLRDSAGNRNTAWKRAVKKAAKKAHLGQPLLTGPLELWIEFALARPKCHYRTGRFSSFLRPDAPAFPIDPPDATKLTRSTEDALKGIVWDDDSRVIDQHISKRYALPPFTEPGARIAVYEVAPR